MISIPGKGGQSATSSHVIRLDKRVIRVYIIHIDTMSKTKKEGRQVSTDRRLIKMGGSLVVAVPNELIEQWNLSKGDEVRFNVLEGAVKIEPKQPTKVENISEETIAAYSQAMKGIQAKITMDTDKSGLYLKFKGDNKEILGQFVHNLWRNLPVFLTMLGVGSVRESKK